jgi:hypothetical protein
MELEVVKQAPALQGAKRENLRPAYVLSAIVVVLAAAVSVVGLLFPSVYRSKDWGNGMSLGNDLVTLVVAVPVLALAILYSARGSVRARLVWLGALYYMVYNYAFYVFGTPVTKLYLPWIAAFVLSGFAFALGMGNLDIESIASRFSSRTPARWIAGYLFFAAAGIVRLWSSQWVKFVVSGKIPEVNGSAEAYKVIAAVDLSFAVPLLISAGYLLWRHRPWGYVLAAVALVQFSTYFAVMTTVCVFGWKLTPGSHLFSAWFINCIVFLPILLLCLAGLLLNVKRPAEVN